MKKFIFTLPVLLLFFMTGFAQGEKPVSGKTLPNFVKLNTTATSDQHQQLFRTHLQMTNDDELRLVATTQDQLGFTHQKFQQYYRGVYVDGCSYTTHAKDGVVQHMTGYFRAIDNINMSLVMPARTAFERALDYVNASEYAWQEGSSLGEVDGYEKPRGDLVIVPDLKQIAPARLAYKFDIYAANPLYRAEVYIDAQTGAFIKENDKLCHADVSASGASLYNGTVSFIADSNGGSYRLRQAANGIQTFDLNNGTNYNNASDVTDSNTNFNAAATAVQAHWGAESTHKYYLQNHSRDSYNGSGAIIKSYVSYSSNYVNAFWDGSRMTYGDGNGTSYGPLVALDIVGHEITHGVVEYTANLVYSYESGALNESFADIFGESVENFATGTNDWYMGTDIGIGGSGALRSMSNPNAFGDPDTYQGTNWHTASSDNGGVHINSGVQNKWFYILTTGESGTNDVGSSYSVSGIGMTKAAAIAYRNLSVYLSRNSQYSDARAGAIQSAIDLYGADSPEVIATTDAWYAVGVGAAYSGGGGGNPPSGSCVEDGNLTLTITLDNYPEETSWSVTSGGSTVASGSYSTANADGSTVTESINGLADGDYTFTINDAYGDGICCSYGSGSYSLTSGSTTIASGGSFGSSESSTFCVEAASGGGGGDTQAPSTPLNLTASNTTETQTTLSWSASSDNVGVTGYNVYSSGNLLGNTPNTSVDITSLSVGSTYSFYVTATDAAGNESGASNTVSVTPTSGADTQAPSTPLNLTASNTTDTETSLSWSASSDNVGVTGYNVYSGGSLLGNVTGTSANVTGLTAGSTYSYYVTAVDAAGNESGASNTVTVTTTGGGGGGGGTDPATFMASYFESGWDGWTDGGSDCYRYNGTRSYEGTRSIRIRDNSGTASRMTSSSFDASGHNSVEVEFYFYPNSMENGEDFWVRFYDGSSWSTVAAYARGSSFENGQFYSATVTISSADYNFPSNAQIAFQCDASGNADQIYIDQVTVSGTGSGLIAAESGQTITALGEPTRGTDISTFDAGDEEEFGELISVFPNPASDYLNITGLSDNVQTISMYSITGALVQEIRTNVNRIDVSGLQAGIYFLSIVDAEGEVMTQKFVKQ